GIFEPVGTLYHSLTKRSEHLWVAAGDGDLPIGGVPQTRRPRGSARVEPRLLPGRQKSRAKEREVRQGGVEHRDIDVLAASGPTPRMKRRQHADRRVQRGA